MSLIFLLVSSFLMGFSHGNILDHCSSSTSGTDTALTCHLRTINSEFDKTNLTGLPGDLVTSLRLDCSDVLFYQSSLEKSSLAHLPRLASFHIEHCKLSRLSPGVFSGLHFLRNLTIRTHNTAWPALSLDIGSGVFAPLTRLEKIDLSANNIWTFPENSFCSLTTLRELNIRKNRLQDLSALSFNDGQSRSIRTPCPNSLALERLDISQNRLILLPPNGLKKLNFLQDLTLEGNEITIISPEALSGLAHLRTLNLASNKIETLPEAVFKETPEISEIYLQNNSLSHLAPNIFSELTRLVILDLGENKLHSIHNSTFSGLIRLVNLNLGHNRLSSLSGQIFGDLFSLQILNLENNEISSINGDTFLALKNLHTLTLSHNKLTFIDSTTLNGLFMLTFLSLDNNLIEEIHPAAFNNNSNVRDINLNGNAFTGIPSAIQNLTFLKTLDLGENLIQDLNTRLVGLPNLYGLRLTGNQISNVTTTVFQQLPSLKVVNLARNQIHSVQEGAFDFNRNLQAVRLDANYLEEVTGLFGNLPNLLWLNVSDNRLTWFDYALIPSQLMWLDLHKNEIRHLENIYGREEFRLQTLDASFNSLTSISSLVIPDSIENLYLNDNLLKTIEPNTFYRKGNLSRVDIFMNELETLELSAVSMMPSLHGERPLPEFYMAGNPFVCDCRLEWLKTGSGSKDHPVIMDLDSLYCQLPHSKKGVNNMRDIQLDSGLSGSVQVNHGSKGVTLESQSEVRSGEKQSGEAKLGSDVNQKSAESPRSSEVNLKNKWRNSENLVLPLMDVPKEKFLCSYQSHCFNLCHCCDFEACDCQMTCPAGCSCYHDNDWSVNIVDCSASARTTIPAIPMDSTEVHLDGNQLGYLPSHGLIGRKNVETLYLNNSGLDSIMNNSLSGLRKLSVLHLEDNYLREIRGFEFQPLESLRELYLHRNSLAFIASDSFVHLKHLEVLTLTGNRLTRFAVWSLSWNPYLSLISLGDNPWSCDCDFVAQALPWIRTNYGKLIMDGGFIDGDVGLQNLEFSDEDYSQSESGVIWDPTSPNPARRTRNPTQRSPGVQNPSQVNHLGQLPNQVENLGQVRSQGQFYANPARRTINLKCVHNGQSWPLLSMNATYCSDSNSAVKKTIGQSQIPLSDDDIFPFLPSLLAIGAVLLFVSTVFLAICRHKKWWGPARACPESCYENQTLEDDKLFDAYIAYSVKDEAWVSQILATTLQQQHLHRSDQPYRLCLHYRDFVMTAYIADTIVEAVESSKRTVLVLSKNFLQSEWCSFEFKSALHTAMRGAKNNLVIVTLGDISTRDLDPDLRVMLRNAIVLQATDKLFWAKLKSALPEPRPVSNATWRGQKGTVGKTSYYDVNERNNWLQPGLPQLHCSSEGSAMDGQTTLQPILDNFHNFQCNQFIHGRGPSESSEMDKTQYTYVEST
ncbi:unnamed protein product [Allacma fusca]|uniref:TIR domain-containing protein n=1 Tax=Allacma fusca TaxID=39272 RepID=A0A8J2JCK7_9HEXA|nr:unnamed protein product [Allacma fusca]